MYKAVIAIAIVALMLSSVRAEGADRTGVLRVSVGAENIRVEGVSPGGEAILRITFISSLNGEPLLGSRQFVAIDDDSDGVVTQELTQKLPPDNVVFAADLSTGNWGLAGRPGHDLREIGITRANFRREENDDVFELLEDYVHVLVVRPKQDEWFLSAVDGGQFDRDRKAEGRLRLLVKNLKARRNKTGPPFRPSSGDLIFVMDPRTLECSVVRFE